MTLKQLLENNVTIIGMIIGISIVVIPSWFLILGPMFNDAYVKTSKELDTTNTCTGLILLQAKLNNYPLSMNDAVHIRDEIKLKSELLKCP